MKKKKYHPLIKLRKKMIIRKLKNPKINKKIFINMQRIKMKKIEI